MQEEIHIKDSNSNFSPENNNNNNKNTLEDENSLTDNDLKNNKIKKNISKFQKFKNSFWLYANKIAFWKKIKNNKNINKKNTQESKIDKQKRLEKRSLDRQIKIYANERFQKEFGNGLGFNFFI